MSAAPDTSEAERYQDQVMANRLPAWVRTASQAQITLVHQAMAASLQARERSAQMMAGLKGIDAFTLPLLRQALKTELGLEEAGLRFRIGHREPVVTSQPVGWPVTRPVYNDIPLLEAALRNFSADEAQGDQLAGNGLVGVQEQVGKLPSAARFAAFCRILDLGGQYQRHLDDSLPPARARPLLAEHLRLAMAVDAHIAWIKGELDSAEHQLLVDLCAGAQALKLRGDPVRLRRLKLLGCALEQIVVLDVRDESWSPVYSSSRRVIVHVPGDPVAPWRAYGNLRQCANDLGRRLRQRDYQKFFSRFVRRRDSQAFFSQVIEGYAQVSDLANIDLEEHLSDWALPLFDALACARIAQIKDDAAQIATPVAALDRDVQAAHDQRLAAEGWALLNVAGFFVPGLGLALLSVAAWQMLGEVYHGIEAWHEGDRSAALDHLCQAAGDVALLAATGAAAGVAIGAWRRAAWVDDLVPVTLEDGSVRLAVGELSAFADTPLPARAQRGQDGIAQLGEQAWVAIDQRYFAAEQRALDGNWQLRAQGGRTALLTGNHAGAWRLWSEAPRQWSVEQLFRRLAISCYPLDDEAIAQVLLATDTTVEHLQALHLRSQAPDALLCDCTLRAALDGRIRRLVGCLRGGERVTDSTLLAHANALPGAAGLRDQDLAELVWAQRRALFERVYLADQSSESPAATVLRRQFPGLPSAVAQELIEQMSAAARQRLQDNGRVPLALAEAARRALWQVRVARVYEGWYFDTPQGLDHARVALNLLGRLPGVPDDMGWRLYEGLQAQAPLLDTAPNAARQFELLHGPEGFQLFDAQGHALGEHPGDLFETLAAAFDHRERDAVGVGDPFGHNLRVLLGRLASSDRAGLEHLLGRPAPTGWFQPARRLADGRLGYPLSGRGVGRGRPRALYSMVRALYPLYEDLEIELWARRLRATGQQVEAQLGRLANELSALRSTLHDWAGFGRDQTERGQRRHFGEALMRGWQRMGPRVIGAGVEVIGYRLNLLGISLESLPELPESISFAHVQELSLRGMGLRQVPRGFLRAFPEVRVLELSGNRLQRLPEGLEGLVALAELDLHANQIALDTSQARVLEQCVNLQYLNLSFNPLGRTFSVRRLSRLRNLNLRGAQLPSLPPALLGRLELVIADLRDNRITTLPERFYQTPLWISSTILLEENPLDEETTMRFELYMRNHSGAGLGAESAPVSARQGWLDALGDGARAEHGGDWDALAAEEGAEDFIGVLGRLQDTADFQQQPGPLAERVFCMLEAMRAHTDLREALFEQARQTLTCQDSVALSFSNLELRMLVWQAQAEAGSAGEQAALLHLGRQLWRLEQVERIALEDLQMRRGQGRDPDQIEVLLAYRVGLRTRLDLPAQPGDMTFARIANVDPVQLDQAQAQVLAEETPERLAESLVDREFWQTWLSQQHSERLAELDEPFQARLATLMEQAEAGPGGEGDAVQRMNQVRDERQAARRALLLTWTEQALRLPASD